MSHPALSALRASLERALAPETLEIEDDSHRHAGHAGAREGGHFRVRIVAERFRSMSRMERHREVYAAAQDLLGPGAGPRIHALNIDARAPGE